MQVIPGAEHQRLVHGFALAGEILAPVAAGEVREDQVLGEGDRGGDHLAGGIHGEAGAVEDQFVVAAHLIHVHDRQTEAAGHRGEDLAAQRPLTLVVGRSVDGDDDAGAGVREFIHRVPPVQRPFPELLVVPGVLADGEGNGQAADFDHRLLFGGTEVARLVEDVVGRQQHLVLAEDDAPAFEHGGGVGGGLAGLGVAAPHEAADNRERQVRGVARELVEGFLGASEEAGFLDEVARGVAVQDEFREDGEPGATRGRAACELRHLGGVARQIPYHRVHLRERDAHERPYSRPFP